MGVPSRQRPGAVLVAAGDPEASWLYRKLTEDPPAIDGARMPKGAPLESAEVELVRPWIEGPALSGLAPYRSHRLLPEFKWRQRMRNRKGFQRTRSFPSDWNASLGLSAFQGDRSGRTTRPPSPNVRSSRPSGVNRDTTRFGPG